VQAALVWGWQCAQQVELLRPERKTTSIQLEARISWVHHNPGIRWFELGG
jgi:hypothetical protein